MAHPFRFVFKVPRTITHDARLRDVDAELAAFVALLEPLGDLVGGLTLQLPPSFGPRDINALDQALSRAPRLWPWSVEVRHADFFGGDGRRALDRVLSRHGAERVVLDTISLFHRTPITDEGHEEWRTKPRVPLLDDALTDRPIVRFIGSDHPETHRGRTHAMGRTDREVDRGGSHADVLRAHPRQHRLAAVGAGLSRPGRRTGGRPGPAPRAVAHCIARSAHPLLTH